MGENGVRWHQAALKNAFFHPFAKKMQRICKVDDEITYYVSNKYGFSLRFCIFAFAKNIYVIGMEALVKTKKKDSF